MTNEQIRAECQLMYEQIQQANERLKEIRAICKHENTFEGNYSYRVGSIMHAKICSYCGTPIQDGNLDVITNQ